MRILVAPDSFKDGCSSIEACIAITKGIRSANPNVDIEICPISDGGEGSVEILQYHLGGEPITVKVSNPLFRKIKADYLLMDNGIAFIEMAQASGLELLLSQERNPMNTSTFGTGELIQDALDRGCRDIIISVGGSATNDLGIGVASALGWQFLDASGNSLAPIGYNMPNVVEIDPISVDSRITEASFSVITDVTNPLYGPVGATYSFGIQKGASSDAIEHLDKGMRHLWKLLNVDGNLSSVTKGYGAAGGLGAGCVVFLDAKIQQGFSKIANLINLQERVNRADIIITGEGHLDGQTERGKVISGICQMAKGKKIIALCGRQSISDDLAHELGLDEIIEISHPHSEAELEFLLAQTTHNLERYAEDWALTLL